MNKAEGMTDSVAQEQNSVERRAELKMKDEKLFFTSRHFPLIFFCMKARFSFGTH